MITEKWLSIMDWEPVYYTKKVPETIHFIHLEQDCESNLLLGLLSMQSMLRCKICNERDLEPCQNVSMSLISKPCFLLACIWGETSIILLKKAAEKSIFCGECLCKNLTKYKGKQPFWSMNRELSTWYTKTMV